MKYYSFQGDVHATCSEESNLTENVYGEEEMGENKRSTSTNISRPGPNKKSKYHADLTSEILSTVQEYFKRPQSTIDCCELLGKTVTTKMRNIKDTRLHIMFEKKINDVLFEAEICALNNQVLTPNPQHYTQVPTPSPQHYTQVPTPSPQHYTQVPTHRVHHMKKTQLPKTVQKQLQRFSQTSLQNMNECTPEEKTLLFLFLP